MGLFQWLRGSSLGTDLMRLSIHMDYTEPLIAKIATNVQGRAAVQWAQISSDISPDMLNTCRIILIALLYAETLVISSDSRKQAIAHMSAALEKWRINGSHSGEKQLFGFNNFNIHVTGIGQVPIWPWDVQTDSLFEALAKVSRRAPGNPITYQAVLKSGPATKRVPAGFWSYTEMPAHLTKVCVPSSPLIAMSAFADEMHKAHTLDSLDELCALLDQVHQYYKKIGKFPAGSQATAVGQSLNAMNRK